MRKRTREYIIYKGDEILMIGNTKEITEKMGWDDHTLYEIVSKTKQWVKEANVDNKTLAFYIEDDEDE